MLLITTPKKAYATKRLIEEAAKIAFPIEAKDVNDLAEQGFKIDLSRFDGLYVRQIYPFFKEVIGLAQEFKAANKLIIDADVADSSTDFNKIGPIQKLAGAQLPVLPARFLSEVDRSRIQYPAVVKWNYGFGANNIYLVNSDADIEAAIKKHPAAELLIQKFIKADYEYKVITIGYKSLPVVIKVKTQPSGFLPDLTDYQVINKDQVREVLSLAEKSAKILGRQLAKVDILEQDGQLYILEVNRFPGLQYFERVSGYNVAKDFIAYLAQL